MVQIRFANADDYKYIVAIDPSLTIEKWMRWVSNKQVMLTFLNGNFAGWLQYGMFIEKIPFVNRLYVPEEFQHNSLGTGLMKFWEFEMVEQGYNDLMLSVESGNSAIDFYKKLGFNRVGDFDYFGDHNEILLAKHSDPSASCCCGDK